MKYELTQEQIELICEGLNALAAVTISDQYVIDDQCVIPRNGKHTVSAKAFFLSLMQFAI